MNSGFDDLLVEMDAVLTNDFGKFVIFHFESGDESAKILLEEESKEYGNKRNNSHISQSEYTVEVSAVYFDKVQENTTLTFNNQKFNVVSKKPVINGAFFLDFAISSTGGNHRWQ